jgi:hypothetical protein
MRERGILDPTALFPAVFGAYNGIPLIKFVLRGLNEHLKYPVQFEADTYFRAGILSALGAVFIAITWALWRPPVYKKSSQPDLSDGFTIGFGFYAVGISLYLLQYLQIGGYWAALAIERTRRFEVMAEHISFPYFSFVLVGLVMMVASANISWKRTATVLMVTLWGAMVLIQGDRRLLLQTVLAVLSVYTFLAARPIRLRSKHIAIMIASYAALAVAGQLRQQIPQLISGAPLHQQLPYANNDDSLLDSIIPGNAELAGPYLSVLYNAEHVKEYSLGSSYLSTLFTVVPRALYPNKPLSPAAALAEEVHRGRIFGFAAAGWGYSPVAEAFLNFGVVGVCAVCSLWMAAFIALSRIRNCAWGIVVAAVLAPESINVNRIDFRTVYLEAFACVIVVALAALVVNSFTRKSFSRCGVRQYSMSMAHPERR